MKTGPEITASMTCALCGHTFNPAGQAACQGCPLRPGCQVVCCPNCGFETVDPGRSGLARLASRFLGKRTSQELSVE